MTSSIRFRVLAVLAFVITALSWVMGCLMDNTNLKSTWHNLVSVEYTGFLENIRYGMHFGKELETFYGMDDTLMAEQAAHKDTIALYIVREDGTVLFATGDEVFPSKELETVSGGLFVHEGMQYDLLGIDDDAMLVVEKDAGGFIDALRERYRQLLVVAIAGLLVLFALMGGASRLMRDEEKSYAVMVTFLAIWILCFGAYLGASAYMDYASSMGEIKENIEVSVANDRRMVRSKGVDDAFVGGMDAYLERYAESIPEIRSVSMDEGGRLDIEADKAYLNRSALDYVLQTILFLVFSAMILTEYQMFLGGIEGTAAEGSAIGSDDGKEAGEI